MTEGQVDEQGQAPSPRHRHSHGDSSTLLRSGSSSEVTQQGVPEETEHTLEESREESRVQSDSDSEDHQNQVDFEKQEEPVASSSPGASAHSSQPVAPDGGWGWMVLVATILVMAMTLAFPSCVAIFYTQLQTEFNTSNTKTSWVPAIMVAVQHAGGPLCSMLVERWGCRVTVMVGGCLSGLGMAVASLARTISELYVTGVITGLGFCFTFQASVTIMGHYFVRRRAFANAMSSTGTALGLITLPLLANFLDGHFGWRGSFLVLGGMLLNCCVCGAVMRPVGPAIKHRLGSAGSPNNHRCEQREREGQRHRARTALFGFLAFLRRHMAFDLLVSNARYRAYALGVTWMMLGFIVPLVYFVPYAMENGMTQSRAALLMSILGLVSISVRPVAAMLFSLPRFRGTGRFVYVFASAVLVNGLSNCICAASPSFEVLLLYMVIFGLSMSLIGTLLFTCMMETVEMSRFHSALGLMSMMESVTLLIGPPLAGILVDSTGQYSNIFYACSISGTLAGIFLMGSFYILDNQRDQEEKTNKMLKPSDESFIYQKPAMILAPDCEYSNVPLHERQAADTDHDTNV